MMCAQITREPCSNAGSDLGDPGRGPGFCISHQLRDAASGLWAPLGDLDSNKRWLEEEDGANIWGRSAGASMGSSPSDQVNIKARTFHG